MGILAYFVHGFTTSNVLTPTYVLVLFITSVLAIPYAIFTLLAYHKTHRSALFVAFLDLCFVGAFIAGVVALRGIAGTKCTSFASGNYPFYVSLGPFGSWGAQLHTPYGVDINKTCALLKTSFAFGIMNIIFFAFTSFLALLIHRHHRSERVVTRRESHSSRHASRTSGSRHSHRGSGGYAGSRSVSGRRPAYV